MQLLFLESPAGQLYISLWRSQQRGAENGGGQQVAVPVLVPGTYKPTVSRIVNPFASRFGPGIQVAGEVKGSKAWEYANGIRNIVFGETRSYTGVSIDEVRQKIAHIILNRIMEGMTVGRVPHTANDYFARSLNPEEESVLSNIHQVVDQVFIERSLGIDPTYGALYFNFRDPDYLILFNKNLTSPMWGLPAADIIGPLNNSFPTTVLGPDNNFFVIYRE